MIKIFDICMQTNEYNEDIILYSLNINISIMSLIKIALL